MELLIVTAFHSGDIDAAVRLYDWIKELGGIDNDVLLVHDPQDDRFKCNRVLLAASKAAKSVTRIQTVGTHKRGWPHGPNAAFLAASKWAFDNKRNFLWLETDCVPVNKGWLNSIESEYETCGKPYLGGVVPCKPPLPPQVMYGVAVYPHTTWTIVEKELKSNHNVAFDVLLSPLIVPQCSQSKRLQLSGHGKNPEHIELVEGVSLYHHDKTGNLIASLRNNIEHKKNNSVSVVITTHNRLNRLRMAYNSCLESKIKDIVITATGYDQKSAEIIREECTQATIVFNKSNNSNEAWIAGCKAAKNNRVTILHDDDKILPPFLGELSKHESHPFCVWNARFHNDENTRSDMCCGPYDGYGVTKCSSLFDSINVNDRLAVTPVRGCFKKDDLIEWLVEAGTRLGKECYYRPDYLIGNDLWIYLRASRKYNEFMSIETPLTSLGCNPDSCTIDAIENGVERLVNIYNVTRDIFNLKARVTSAQFPLHIVTIALDAAPFLVGQLQVFNRLTIPWKWTIVQGTAEPTHCTSWCKGISARDSSDSTLDILSAFSKHRHINVISKTSWDGKLEMVNAALLKTNADEIVLQVDVDEFWEAKQVETIYSMLLERPDMSHAMFWCRYFVGPGIVMNDRNCYANNPNHEWRRAWRRTKRQKFITHEPPVMSGDQTKFITHEQTEAIGLVFDHYSYVLPQQLRFKEQYYGYANALRQWNKLQDSRTPGNISKYFDWAKDGGSTSVI